MPPEIISPRLWTGDTTPERLQSLLVDHGERMAVLSDEGGIFEVMAGLYSDGRANLDVFLQGHAGQAVRVDRQSRTAHLDAPALSFGLAIQPTILADMGNGGKKRFRGNGTLARFLYAVPRSNVGSRDVRAFYQIPATISANYWAGIFALLAIPPQMVDGREIPRRLTLTPDALECWHAFAEMVEQRQGQDGDLESISDWSGKLPGAALRIAGNFHLVEYGTPAPAQIEALTIERALDLCTLLIDHAKAAFNLMQADTSTNDAKAIYQWIIEGRLERFRRGEVYRHFKGRFTGNTDRLDKALNDLKTRALVKEKREKTTGREATGFNVNPEVLVPL
jgi:putative DNA primase/helicase